MQCLSRTARASTKQMVVIITLPEGTYLSGLWTRSTRHTPSEEVQGTHRLGGHHEHAASHEVATQSVHHSCHQVLAQDDHVAAGEGEERPAHSLDGTGKDGTQGDVCQ